MTIDTGMVAIFITILLALMGTGVAWGVLSEKVKNNRRDIDANSNLNHEEHQTIFHKLDEIKQEMANNRVR